MRSLSIFLTGIFLLALAFAPVAGAQRKIAISPSPSPTPTPVNSYALFWPITAGRVMSDQLYFLKSLKEQLREMFIFSDIKKAEYNVTLSEKRTVEAEKLFLINQDYSYGKQSLDVAQAKRGKAQDLLMEAQEKGRNVVDLNKIMVSSFERQRELLSYIETQVPEEQKSVLSESIDKLNSLLTTLQ